MTATHDTYRGTVCKYCGITSGDFVLVHPGTKECVNSADCEVRMLNTEVATLRAQLQSQYRNGWNEAIEAAALVVDAKLSYPSIRLNGGASDTDGNLIRPLAHKIRALEKGKP
jgi:hypothetical protein